MKSIISTKRKHCVIVWATHSEISSANLWGLGHNGFTAARSLQWNNMESMHCM